MRAERKTNEWRRWEEQGLLRPRWAIAEEIAEDEEVSAWAKRMLGFEADEVQARVLDDAGGRLILNCSRQWGKSTLTAAKVVHRAYTRARSLTVVVSPTAAQSSEFVRKAAEFVRRLGIAPKGDGGNRISLVFPNGSRIVGLPGTEGSVRGYSAVSLLVIDEAARVSDESYHAVMPMLAVGKGDLWVLSTPKGKRGFFYDIWSKGGAEWTKVSVAGWECARIPKQFLDEERDSKGELRFQQEYGCQFVDLECSLFDREQLLAAVRTDIKPLFG